MNIIILFIWFLYPLAEAIAQRFTYFKANPIRPNYLMLFLIRGIAAIIHAALLDVQPNPWYQWPALLLFQIGTFWLLFDPILNMLRKKKFSYEGINSGWLKGIPYWTQAIISIAMIIIGFFTLFK